jgi:hypothetical protein
MDNPEIAKYIAGLKSKGWGVRLSAVEALGKIGNASAVPVLIKALEDVNWYVRYHAAEALGKIGDHSAVPALIAELKDKSEDWFSREYERYHAAEALGNIGNASAVPALIEALEDKYWSVRRYAASALRKIGNSEILPRNVLANSQLSPQQRVDVLNRLRRVRYKDDDSTLRYKFPDTRTLCLMVLDEEDADARSGAHAVLSLLNKDQDQLVRPSHLDTNNDARELLRAAKDRPPKSQPETLLRAVDEPKENGE